MDVVNDGCDPASGGVDCAGYCVGPATLSIAIAKGVATLTGEGTLAATYRILAEDNLSSGNFVSIGTATADLHGRFTFVDDDAANHPARFYRTAALGAILGN